MPPYFENQRSMPSKSFTVIFKKRPYFSTNTLPDLAPIMYAKVFPVTLPKAAISATARKFICPFDIR
ncbi:SNARE associated Golgi protein [Thermoanaerobacterium thermosaccharolyticum]|uniref:SNARE associated Golgi protein n=1 Tax=Thermoanaerobacterium thermosaccharolyticum TaxID=1517 RepID=A0A223HXG5_THETR|nr:SNARE associated Golgi protein [Thermoanaerobacterium thermosaccharolyticum]